MSDDWKPGDLALCVRRDGGGFQPLRFIDPGEVVTVAEARNGGWPAIGLSFEESRGFFTFYDSRCFRKIKPLTDEEREQALRELRSPVDA